MVPDARVADYEVVDPRVKNWAESRAEIGSLATDEM